MLCELLVEEQIDLVKSWAVQAGKIALDWQERVTERIKSDATPVSDADLAVETFLIEKVQKYFPGNQVIAEEAGVVGKETGHAAGWVWAIDPIDGTKAFVRRMPVWGVSIGLLYRGTPVAGWIYLPVSQDLFWGWDRGAFWNGRPLEPDPDKTFDDSNLFLAMHANAHTLNQISYPRVQAYGSTVAHLAFLAAGLAAGVLIRRVHLWDLAGGLPILHRSGCVMAYRSGRPLDLTELMDGRKTQEEILATRPEWMDRLRAEIH